MVLYLTDLPAGLVFRVEYLIKGIVAEALYRDAYIAPWPSGLKRKAEARWLESPVPLHDVSKGIRS